MPRIYPFAPGWPLALPCGPVHYSQTSSAQTSRLPPPRTWIISPPPIHGGMASSTSDRPHRKPMPVGPHILCELPTIQSAPSRRTSTDMWGRDWQQSRRTRAPTCMQAPVAGWRQGVETASGQLQGTAARCLGCSQGRVNKVKLPQRSTGWGTEGRALNHSWNTGNPALSTLTACVPHPNAQSHGQ